MRKIIWSGMAVGSLLWGLFMLLVGWLVGQLGRVSDYLANLSAWPEVQLVVQWLLSVGGDLGQVLLMVVWAVGQFALLALGCVTLWMRRQIDKEKLRSQARAIFAPPFPDAPRWPDGRSRVGEVIEGKATRLD